jgi:hypothetical protein
MQAEDTNSRWEWNKDGEFWFNDGCGEVGGALNHTGFPYSVGFGIDSGPKTPERFYDLVLRLSAKFPEYEMRLSLSGEEGKLLRELSRRGLIEWEDMQHPYSKEARVLRIVRPPPG